MPVPIELEEEAMNLYSLPCKAASSKLFKGLRGAMQPVHIVNMEHSQPEHEHCTKKAHSELILLSNSLCPNRQLWVSFGLPKHVS